MNIADLTVEVRNSSLERVAQITELDLVGFTAVLRFNNVGSWKTVLPADSIAAEELRQPGAGILVTGPNGVILSGPTTAAKKVQTADDPQGIWEIEGVDDSILLQERLAYPDPTQPDVSLQTVAYDEIIAPASSVLYYFVDANMGPSAPIERKIPSLALAPDLELGSTIIGKLRFDVLGSIFSKLVAPDGLGFDIKQQDDELVFSVYEPVDRSGDIRLDVENNRLSSSEYTYENPKATRAIVAGQGAGAERELVEVATTESEDSELAWGRRIEVFKDQRDAQATELLEQSGLELLAKDGKTLEGISVTPADDGSMRYGFDWNLGDKVSVVANETTAVAVVTEVALSVTENGVYLIATVGQPEVALGDKVASVQSNQEDRISNLERHGQAGGGGGGGGGGGSIGYYGSFYDMTDQPLASITAAQPIAIGQTAEAIGVSITSANRVLFANAGTYSLTFSIQLTNLANALAKAIVWVKKNGVDYADSATELDLPARKSAGVPNRQVLTINYVATAAAGDYVQVFWAGDSLDLKVESLPAGTSPVYPAVPSIILTATQVGNSGLVVSPDAPVSTGVLWLDTDEPSDIPVPTGGTANQVLAKIDSTNYNTQWITPPSVPVGGTTGQVLAKSSATNYDAGWVTPNGSGNVIINGAFDIWQRGTSSASTAYLADRWQITAAATSGISPNQSRVNGIVATETSYALRVQQGSATTSGLVEYAARQIIERQNFQPLGGKRLTLSFWYRSNKTGSHGTRLIGSIDNTGGQDTGQAFTVTTANVWQKITLQFDSTLNITSWGANAQNGIGGYLDIGFRAGSTGQTSVTTGDYFEITAIQLEAGSVATPFRRNAASLQAELAACQRYYYRSISSNTFSRHPVINCAGLDGTRAWFSLSVPVPLRDLPTVEFSAIRVVTLGATAAFPITNVTALASGEAGYVSLSSPTFQATVASGLSANTPYFIGSNNSTAGFIAVNAEL
jgi:hypothetical protein